ncbi:hypothetical protein BC830DRAFT_1172593 [Chytriomyces sp. MP71]|nr:hypothetical protein BC830DRAFT_1172593 [Chytriomyces sp. MP71]
MQQPRIAGKRLGFLAKVKNLRRLTLTAANASKLQRTHMQAARHAPQRVRSPSPRTAGAAPMQTRSPATSARMQRESSGSAHRSASAAPETTSSAAWCSPPRGDRRRRPHPCGNCRARRKRCDERSPCAFCAARDWPCAYDRRKPHARFPPSARPEQVAALSADQPQILHSTSLTLRLAETAPSSISSISGDRLSSDPSHSPPHHPSIPPLVTPDCDCHLHICIARLSRIYEHRSENSLDRRRSATGIQRSVIAMPRLQIDEEALRSLTALLLVMRPTRIKM